jgi:hypothetical protein
MSVPKRTLCPEATKNGHDAGAALETARVRNAGPRWQRAKQQARGKPEREDKGPHLLAKAVAELRAHDAFGEAGEILHFLRARQGSLG